MSCAAARSTKLPSRTAVQTRTTYPLAMTNDPPGVPMRREKDGRRWRIGTSVPGRQAHHEPAAAMR